MSLKNEIHEQFGDIDIYLFDQLHKGRFDNCLNLLDVGSGHGRNLIYFLRNGFDVHAVDRAPQVIQQVRNLATQLAPSLPKENFQEAEVGALPYADNKFDAVIGIAVLHFAEDEAHFHRMLDDMWRVLKTGGILFVRLASSIGLENRIQHISERRFLLPDGSERFLVDEAILLDATKRLDAQLLDPIKTTNVGNLRCMTTWCVKKIRH